MPEPVTQEDRAVCEHCPDGHSDPTTRPWAAFVASERDGDGQPTHLHVAPTAGQHVAESDAQWVRGLLNAARPSVPTVTAEQVREAAEVLWNHYGDDDPDESHAALAVTRDMVAALGIEVRPTCFPSRNRHDHFGPIDWSDLRMVVGTCKACGREVRQP